MCFTNIGAEDSYKSEFTVDDKLQLAVEWKVPSDQSESAYVVTE